MPMIDLSNDDLKLIVDTLDLTEPDDFAGAERARPLAQRLSLHVERTVTVVCRETGGTPNPLLYTVRVEGPITEKKITRLIREARAEDIGSDEDAMIWVNRLDPLVVLEGDVRQVADYRIEV